MDQTAKERVLVEKQREEPRLEACGTAHFRGQWEKKVETQKPVIETKT